MVFMPVETMLMYFMSLGLVGGFGGLMIEFVSKAQSRDAAQQKEHVCKSLCLGYKIKGSCRHLSQ